MKITLVVVMTLIVGFGRAVAGEGAPSVKIWQYQKEDKKAMIRIATLSESKRVMMRIKNEDGRVMYRESLKGNTVYRKRFDLSSMPDGLYMVEVISDQGVTQEAFNLKAGRAEAVYFKPAVQIEPRLVKVMFENSITSPVTLKLYDKQGEVLFEESVSSQAQFSKGLDVSKLPAGQYSLSIVGDNYTYAKSITLE